MCNDYDNVLDESRKLQSKQFCIMQLVRLECLKIKKASPYGESLLNNLLKELFS